MFALAILLCYPIISQSAPPQNRQQAKQAIKSLGSISTAAKKLQTSANRIVIKKRYCLPGTGTPTKASTRTKITRHRSKLNKLNRQLRNVEATVNWMLARPVVWGKLVPAGTTSRIKNIRRSIQRAGTILAGKERALKKAPRKNCTAKLVQYEKVNIPTVPAYVCTKKEKRALTSKAKKAVNAANRNVKKAHADADRYVKAKRGQGRQARAALDKLFNKAQRVYRSHKQVLSKAKAAHKAAKKLKVVKCDKNGVIITTPGLQKNALKIPPQVRPTTGACDKCKPDQAKYNSQAKALTKIRNKIKKLVRRHGGPRGKVPPKIAKEYRSLMQSWNAKHGLVKALKQALDFCIRDKCSAKQSAPRTVPGSRVGANMTVPALIRPITGSCRPCLPSERTHNQVVGASTVVRNKIGAAISRKDSKSYNALMSQWNKLSGDAKAKKATLLNCLNSQCTKPGISIPPAGKVYTPSTPIIKYPVPTPTPPRSLRPIQTPTPTPTPPRNLRPIQPPTPTPAPPRNLRPIQPPTPTPAPPRSLRPIQTPTPAPAPPRSAPVTKTHIRGIPYDDHSANTSLRQGTVSLGQFFTITTTSFPWNTPGTIKVVMQDVTRGSGYGVTVFQLRNVRRQGNSLIVQAPAHQIYKNRSYYITVFHYPGSVNNYASAGTLRIQ